MATLRKRLIAQDELRARGETAGDFGEELFGGGGAGGEAQARNAGEVERVELLGGGDEGGWAAGVLGDFGQAFGVGGGSRTEDEEAVDAAGEVADGILALLGGVADVAMVGEAGKEAGGPEVG